MNSSGTWGFLTKLEELDVGTGMVCSEWLRLWKEEKISLQRGVVAGAESSMSEFGFLLFNFASM